jgi:hypothetical protein
MTPSGPNPRKDEPMKMTRKVIVKTERRKMKPGAAHVSKKSE